MKKWILYYNIEPAGITVKELVEVEDHYTESDVVDFFYSLAEDHYDDQSDLYYQESDFANREEFEEAREQDKLDRINCWAEEYKDES